MPKVNIDLELGKVIKTLRIENKIKAAELAKDMNKSVGYISNIENAKRKSIEITDLFRIFEILIKDEKKRESTISNILERLSVTLTAEEIKREEWLEVFDKQYRAIPIPDSFIEYISIELEKNNLSDKQVINQLNSNSSLGNDFKNQPYNKIIVKITPEKNRYLAIKFKLSPNYLSDILNKNITKANYINLQGVIYSINILKGLSSSNSFDEAESILKEHKILTLDEQREILINEKVNMNIASKNIDSIGLSAAYVENIKYLRRIISHFNIFRDLDVEYLNSKLSVFSENMDVFPSYTIALLAMPLAELKDVNKSILKDLLNSIEDLILKTISENKKNDEFILDKF